MCGALLLLLLLLRVCPGWRLQRTALTALQNFMTLRRNRRGRDGTLVVR